MGDRERDRDHRARGASHRGELVASGYVSRERNGRRNRYAIEEHLAVPDPLARSLKINELLDVLTAGRPPDNASVHRERRERSSGCINLNASAGGPRAGRAEPVVPADVVGQSAAGSRARAAHRNDLPASKPSLSLVGLPDPITEVDLPESAPWAHPRN